MKRKKVVIIVIIMVLLGGGTLAYFKLHKKTPAVTYQTAQAAKGTLISTVSGSGNIVVSSSANVSPSISGTVANLEVSVGDQVKEGQTLFTITNDDLDVTVSKTYTSLLQAQQKLTEAKLSLKTSKEDYEDLIKSSSITTAQLAYDQAKQNLAQAEYQLEQDEDLLQQYEDENEENEGTHSEAKINALEKKIAVDKTTITSKKNDIATAKQDLDEIKAGTSPDITAAKSRVESVEINVRAAENDVTAAELDYANQKESADKRTVTATIEGTIAAINVADGDELGNSGSNNTTSSSSGSTAIVIQNMTSLKAVVDINEVDITAVKVDQKVNMTFDAVSDLTLTGKVEKVDATGTATQGVVTYSATIGFDSLDERVRPEMSVNANITIDVKQDVLVVSSGAVKTSGELHYVQILQNGSPVQQTVEIGTSNDTQTEITSGISEGASVVTQTITAGQTSTSTNSSRNSGGGFGGGTQMFIGGPGGL